MFEEKIAALNRANEQSAVCYEKRTYTVDEIQDILGISRPTAASPPTKILWGRLYFLKSKW